jgi:hypothetical protein
MSRFKRISSFKRKKVTVDADSATLLSKIAAFHSTDGQPLTESDILGSVFMEGGVDGRLRFPTPAPEVELNLNLPEAAWDNLTAICEKHGVDERKVVEKVIASLARSLPADNGKKQPKAAKTKTPKAADQESATPH